MSAHSEADLPLQGMVLQTVQFGEDGSYTGDNREQSYDLDSAEVTTSMVANSVNMHKVVLDIDMPAKLIPSSTPGHFHLYIDREIPWPAYQRLLEALKDASILEPGFVSASLARGYTAARLPWIKKAVA